MKEIVQLHFDEEDGAPFWIEKKSELSFNPIEDVEEVPDLQLFADDPSYSSFPVDKLRSSPRDLIPKKYDPSEYGIYSTGGRTGTPKWTVWVDDGVTSRIHRKMNQILDEHGVSRGRDLFYIGPTGPHVFGHSMKSIANERNGSFLTIDLDPRWIRQTKTDPDLQDTPASEKYLDHLQNQSQDVLRQHGEEIGILVSTPTIIQMLYQSDVLSRLQLDAVIFAGQAIKPENYQHLSQELDAFFQGWYGNTLIGAQPQVDYSAEHDAVVYQPQEGHVIFEVIDPKAANNDEYTQVEYGETGRTMAHVVREGLLAPYLIEDDAAIRLPPKSDHISDCLGNPDIPQNKADDIESGVY
ncbi:hypothetical protein [Halobellus sp. EA9]|uniref:hypothetical protein n=1 Tax=Halobellus sp. EA9 TaxID=3421647 RepID=UPI003EB6BF88